MKKLLLIIIGIGFLSGCAQSYHMAYNERANGNGKINVKLSAAMRNVNITLNDSLITEDKYTRDVTIGKVPAGKYKLRVVGTDRNRSGDVNYVDSLNIGPNDYKTVLVEAPPLSTGYWIYSGLTYMASFGLSYYLIY